MMPQLSLRKIDVKHPLLNLLVEVALLVRRTNTPPVIHGIRTNRRNVEVLAHYAHSVAVEAAFGPISRLPVVWLDMSKKVGEEMLTRK
jgi:hypothetical protein